MADGRIVFSAEVLRLRAEYMHHRLATNLFTYHDRPLLDLDVQRRDKSYMTFWYDDGTDRGQSVRVYDVPGMLSGDILRMHQQLPSVSGHFEVDGNEIRPRRPIEPPQPLGDDSEDVEELLTSLPVVSVDLSRHFVKNCKYKSEILNLVKCQGGSVPGRPLSPHIVQLLGRSAAGQLVFEQLLPYPNVLGHIASLAAYRSWLLQLVDGLASLHLVGIIHRDLRIANLVFSLDRERLVICDLEGRWGEREAPEVAFEGGLDDSGWTTASDVYDIGNYIKGMVYANAPIPRFVDWPVPPPLQGVVDACMRPKPEDRPTLAILRKMIENIQV